MSPLQKKRASYIPVVPDLLLHLDQLSWKEESGKKATIDPKLAKSFPNTANAPSYLLQHQSSDRKSPLNVGVVFSGGPASGGHNVIAALFWSLKKIHPKSRLFGFLDGPSGIIQNCSRELHENEIPMYLNQGGFDWIGSGRTKVETAEQLAACLNSCKTLGLDGLVLIGGDDTNTNAAVLAEYFLTEQCKTCVIGVPKTIDGDLRSAEIEISFGFDTACKTYAEMIGNIARDALSAKKYYHFIKLMGRSASHIALECALATHPNLTWIGEEGCALSHIVNHTADLICKRADAGKGYGVVLVPEGLIEFIPEIRALIAAFNQMKKPSENQLSPKEKEVFKELPEKIQKQMLLDRDAHGNIPVSQIDTQVLLMELVQKELKRRGFSKSISFQEHFLGYEGRSCFPSNFDANYSYTLGILASLSVRDHLTGVLCSVQNLTKHPKNWTVKAVPIIQLMHWEMRSGKEKPVIRKAVVDLNGKAFVRFAKERSSWGIEDHYQYPGPIQFFGEADLTDLPPLSLLA